jgi:hypothetical protein
MTVGVSASERRLTVAEVRRRTVMKDGRIQCPSHQGEDFNCAVWEKDGEAQFKCYSHNCPPRDIRLALWGLAPGTYSGPLKQERKPLDEAERRKLAKRICMLDLSVSSIYEKIGPGRTAVRADRTHRPRAPRRDQRSTRRGRCMSQLSLELPVKLDLPELDMALLGSRALPDGWLIRIWVIPWAKDPNYFYITRLEMPGRDQSAHVEGMPRPTHRAVFVEFLKHYLRNDAISAYRR